MGLPYINHETGVENFWKTIQSIINIDYRWDNDGKIESKQPYDLKDYHIYHVEDFN